MENDENLAMNKLTAIVIEKMIQYFNIESIQL